MPASPASAAPRSEDQRVEEADIDAQGLDDLALVAAGANERAEARSGDEPIQHDADHDCHGRDGEPVDRISDARKDLDMTVEEGGNGEIERLPSPDDHHQLVEEQGEAEGREHLIEQVALVKRPQHENLEDGGDDEHGDERQRNGEPIGSRRREGRDQAVAADHEHRAVRQIDDAHDAEHQRHAHRHQEQHQAELQAVEQLLDQERPGHGGSGRRAISLRAMTMAGFRRLRQWRRAGGDPRGSGASPRLRFPSCRDRARP